VGLIPVPLRTLAEGVVWIPDEAYVRAGAMGFVEHIAAEPGSRVEVGQLLFVLRDSRADADVAVAQQRVRELEVQHTRSVSEDRAVAALVADELAYARENLERALERRTELRIEAPSSGTFLVPRAADLPGRFAIQGELLGYVVDLDQLVVRAVVPQSRADLVRELQRGAEVRLAQDLAVSLPARAMRVAPGGLQRLPATALGHQGGGEIAVDPRDASGTTAIERVFQVELDLDAPDWPIHLGGRAYVRFEHGFEPLWFQALRSLRQTFLSRLYV
jgi:putative peptide zinc metalloprotease protein